MGTLKLILTLIGGVVFAALVLTAARSFEEENKLLMWLKAVIGACAFIATNLAAPVAPAWLGLVTVALPLGCFAYLFIWWEENGSTVRELIIFILMEIMLHLTAMSSMARVIDITSNWIARGLVMSIPSIVSITLLAFMISNMIAFRRELDKMSSEGGDEDDED